MSLWNRLFNASRRTAARRLPGERPAASLGLESLEQRCTPALVLADNTAGLLTLTFDGKNDHVVITEDPAAASVKVQANGKNLGTFTGVTAGIALETGGGHDHVFVRAKSNYVGTATPFTWDVDLGSGNDSFHYIPGRSYTDQTVNFNTLLGGSGHDFVEFLFHKSLTNSTIAIGATALGATAAFDLGGGNDHFKLFKGVTLTNSAIGAEGTMSSGNDHVFVWGNGKLSGSMVEVTIDLGSGKNHFHFDDDRLNSGSVNMVTLTGGDDRDVANIIINGDVNSADSQLLVSATLNGGKDHFSAVIAGSFDVNASGSTITNFGLAVDGGSGDDAIHVNAGVLDVNTSGGGAAVVSILGGLGRDVIHLNVARWDLVGDTTVSVEVFGGDGSINASDGADRIFVHTVLSDDTPSTATFDFNLQGEGANDFVVFFFLNLNENALAGGVLTLDGNQGNNTGVFTFRDRSGSPGFPPTPQNF